MHLFFVLLAFLALPSLPLAATLTVAPGQSIQAALDHAQTGDVIRLDAGTHYGRLTIPRDGLTLEGAGAGQTILDGSSPTQGWTAAGSGVWKATLGHPQALTAQGHAVWMITDANMQGAGMAALQRSATGTVTTAWGPVTFWDGLDALFGNSGDVTYLRFRDGGSPAGRNVRSAPAGGVIHLPGRHTITIRNLTVQGGQLQIEVTGGSRDLVIEDVTAWGGKNRIALHDGGGHNVLIRRSRLTLKLLGQQAFPPGVRNNTSYAATVNLHSYMQNKFLAGDTETNDASIVIAGGSTNVQVLDSTISHGQMGIVLYQRSAKVLIKGNTFHHFNDIGIYMNADHTEMEVTDNLFYNSTHHMRLESMSRGHSIWIYANRFHNPVVETSQGPGKHIFIPPPGGSVSPAKVWVYHNSFAGGGYALDMGGTSERAFTYPHLQAENNVFSSTGISSGGTRVIGKLADNLTQQVWPGTAVPDFVLPATFRDRAPRLDLPGMTAAFFRDGKPDHGALQAGGGSPAPPPPPPTALPAPRNLRVLSTTP